MNTASKITKYLSTLKTSATVYEVAKYAQVNLNTARKLLGTSSFTKLLARKCRVSAKSLSTYQVSVGA